MTDLLSLDDQSHPPGPTHFGHADQLARWPSFPFPIATQSLKSAGEWHHHPARSVTARGIHLPFVFLQSPNTSTLFTHHPTRTSSAPTRLSSQSHNHMHHHSLQTDAQDAQDAQSLATIQLTAQQDVQSVLTTSAELPILPPLPAPIVSIDKTGQNPHAPELSIKPGTVTELETPQAQPHKHKARGLADTQEIPKSPLCLPTFSLDTAHSLLEPTLDSLQTLSFDRLEHPSPIDHIMADPLANHDSVSPTLNQHHNTTVKSIASDAPNLVTDEAAFDTLSFDQSTVLVVDPLSCPEESDSALQAMSATVATDLPPLGKLDRLEPSCPVPSPVQPPVFHLASSPIQPLVSTEPVPVPAVTQAIIPATVRSSRPLQVNKSANPPVQRRSKLPVLRSNSTPTHTPPKHTSSMNDLDSLLPKPPLTLSTSISISTSTIPARPSTPISRIGRDKGTGRIPVRTEAKPDTTPAVRKTVRPLIKKPEEQSRLKKKRTPDDVAFKCEEKKREEVGEANVLMSKNPQLTCKEQEEDEKAPAPISIKEKRERQSKREEQVKYWRVREEREAREIRLAARRRLMSGDAKEKAGAIEKPSRLAKKSVKFNLKKNKTIEINLK
ncbi:hypothetical protein CLU79DRAFT_753620 [Phycomyces nitens]|nr:hypothetical protein CLU79DRAFT_753620 [Phycomyces nitens]